MMQWTDLMLPIRKAGESPQANSDAARSAFEIDYDRLIFSHPFRKLQDKTQVVPLPEEDFVHTRLTHSLEVSSVARSLGKMSGSKLLAKYPDLAAEITSHDFGAICAAAALAHDIGNPPFGHSGETAISQFFANHSLGLRFRNLVSEHEWMDLINFEGNAQGFRLLTKGSQSALRLTFPALSAFTKYPKASIAPKVVGRRSQKKFGYFASEQASFQALAKSLKIESLGQNAYLRHPLTFLVEAADDICYLIIDLEDACRLGLVDFENVEHFFAQIIQERYQADKLKKINSLNEKLGVLRALTINQLIQECILLFMENEADMRLGIYDRSLADEIPSAPILKEISKLSIKQIYQSKQVIEREITGYKVLEGILISLSELVWQASQDEKIAHREALLAKSLPDGVGQLILSAPTVYDSLREMLDFVSGLTDRHALKLYRQWNGI